MLFIFQQGIIAIRRSGMCVSVLMTPPAAPPPSLYPLRPRFIAFVLGGVTFSEVRSTYEIAESTKNNIIIGSNTKIITAEVSNSHSDSRTSKAFS